MANIIFQAASTDEHFIQIVDLQKRNHKQYLSEEQQVQDGFLFAEHSTEILNTMASVMPQMIAVNNGKVVGYCLAMNSAMQYYLPTLTPMFAQFENCQYQGRLLTDYEFMVGGQVCVDEEFRGLGLMNQLYQSLKKMVANHYKLCVTEISSRNLVSLKAHYKAGFKSIGNYNDGEESWNIVILDFTLGK
ncbi:GNAT family N-acetyltransferase [Pedobacter miscanthi]|uniref:GNAT family N-acetyltransferase n=1 Tax=Pedobacter miscanthi TaxID=2259170 RepID=UPI0013144506|nr:GNAT family N-acetyltransferase [Pedobacter miscanthi]